jgi:hypothetical protein
VGIEAPAAMDHMPAAVDEMAMPEGRILRASDNFIVLPMGNKSVTPESRESLK